MSGVSYGGSCNIDSLNLSGHMAKCNTWQATPWWISSGAINQSVAIFLSTSSSQPKSGASYSWNIKRVRVNCKCWRHNIWRVNISYCFVHKTGELCRQLSEFGYLCPSKKLGICDRQRLATTMHWGMPDPIVSMSLARWEVGDIPLLFPPPANLTMPSGIALLMITRLYILIGKSWKLEPVNT